MLFFNLAKVIYDNVLGNNISVNFFIYNYFKLTDSFREGLSFEIWLIIIIFFLNLGKIIKIIKHSCFKT